ncbi:MAG TPA: (d)CMP kinase [Gemmatimonadales bacterium]|nr:(d)CMP kinase [Gemmatimonadales bacterium]
MRVIAIDGPAASGKSSTAAAVARRLGWAHLDSGALYRAITLAVLDNLAAAGPERRWSAEQIIGLAEDLPVRLVLVRDEFRPEVAGVDVAEAIRAERVTARVSEIAALPPVRHWVNVRQREAAAARPDGVVVDGRDIGTVVFPDAPLKIFLTASPEERARRRLAQRGAAGGTGAEGGGGAGGRRGQDAAELTRETAALAARDQADATRAVAPLRAAADALHLDTTRLSLEEQVARVVALARERFPG